MNYSSTPDADLVTLYVQKQDKEAFSALYDRYIVYLYRFVYSMCGNREVTEDIVSETFKILLNELGSYNGESKLFTFIASIAKFKLYHWFRDESKSNRWFVDEESQLFEDDLEEIIPIDPQYSEKLDTVLEKLHPNYREVLTWRYLENKSIREISELTQKEEGTVRVLIHRALESATTLAKTLT